MQKLGSALRTYRAGEPDWTRNPSSRTTRPRCASRSANGDSFDIQHLRDSDRDLPHSCRPQNIGTQTLALNMDSGKHEFTLEARNLPHDREVAHRGLYQRGCDQSIGPVRIKYDFEIVDRPSR